VYGFTTFPPLSDGISRFLTDAHLPLGAAARATGSATFSIGGRTAARTNDQALCLCVCCCGSLWQLSTAAFEPRCC
jgi:hypothetical protein